MRQRKAFIPVTETLISYVLSKDGWDSKFYSVPSPVFPVRLTPFFRAITSYNQFKSALSINLIVVKHRMVFHRLHKHRRQTLWMPGMSEDSPLWKTFSKGGPNSSTNMENLELT